MMTIYIYLFCEYRLMQDLKSTKNNKKMKCMYEYKKCLFIQRILNAGEN